mmetsp:Transcript_22195/g.88072  ORF Transcript_22195/g.88072 Transcript_22195/m.88072 type:complete len:207 (+) Transcript_22195:43-663(+)
MLATRDAPSYPAVYCGTAPPSAFLCGDDSARHAPGDAIAARAAASASRARRRASRDHEAGSSSVGNRSSLRGRVVRCGGASSSTTAGCVSISTSTRKRASSATARTWSRSATRRARRSRSWSAEVPGMRGRGRSSTALNATSATKLDRLSRELAWSTRSHVHRHSAGPPASESSSEEGPSSCALRRRTSALQSSSSARTSRRRRRR